MARSFPKNRVEFQDTLQRAHEAEQRHLSAGDRSALNAAVSAWDHVLGHPGFASADVTSQLTATHKAGAVYLRRYRAVGSLDDLNRALELWRSTIDHARPDSPDLPMYLNNLSSALSDRYAHTGHRTDLEEAIQLSEQAVQCTPPDSPNLPLRLNNLGIGLRVRYAHAGRPEDLAEAIRISREAVQRTPQDSPQLPQYLTSLGNALSDRYERMGRPDDLEEAIQAFDQAEHGASPDSPDLPMYFTNLGNGLIDRFARAGQLDDLQGAVALYEQAVRRTPSDSPDLPMYLTNLSIGLWNRYIHSGLLADLDEAIRASEQAVQRTPSESPDLPSRLNNLSNVLRDRYARTGLLTDLEEAIRVSKEVVHHTPTDSPDLPIYHNNLGNGLRSRYLRSGRTDDLQEAIAALKQAVLLTSSQSPDLPSRLTNLSNGLRDRYSRTGRLEDLAEAIQVSEQALQLTPPDSPVLPSLLTNLGTGLRDRYARTGQLEDLLEAVAYFESAVRCTPSDSPSLPMYLNNLGVSLRDRYTRSARVEDLSEAIRIAKQAVECTPVDSPDLARHLNNLGASLRDRSELMGWQEDLEEAIGAFKQAVQRTSTGSPELPLFLNSLGLSLLDCCSRLGPLDGMVKAVQCLEQAVQLAPPDSPNLPMYLLDLGNGLRCRHAYTGRHEDLVRARFAFERACRDGLQHQPEVTIASSASWSDWALERNAWQEAHEACVFGRKAIDQLLQIQLSRAAKESWLREAQGLSICHGYALARLGQSMQAVEALEAGRARLLAEALETMRRDLQRLPEMHQQIAYDRYLAAANHRQFLQQQLQSPPDSLTDRRARLLQAIEAANDELNEAIAAIREVPGYEDFFAPPTFATILRAVAPSTPLIYLLTTSAGSLALIVQVPVAVQGTAPRQRQPEQVVPVWLDSFIESDLDTLLLHGNNGEVAGGFLPGQLSHSGWLKSSLKELLSLVGKRLMAPVAQELRGLAVREVALIASGRLALLPLPAVRYQLDDRELAFLDEFTVAYVPTARAASHARAAAEDRKHATTYLAGVGNPLPSPAQLAVHRDELQIELAALANAGIPPNIAKEMETTLSQPLASLVHQGRTLLSVALQIREAAGPPADALVALALRWPASLAHARSELESLVDLLPAGASRPLYEHEARRAALLETLPGATLVHLSCHGNFRPDDPLQSGLLLADGELTLRDILANDFTALDSARLVVLSACQTAITDFRTLPDESIGLPAGLIQAGVPAVVGTLWSVNDASTALFMTRFYEFLLKDGLPAPEALRQAQRWLRDVTNAELEAYLTRHETLARSRDQKAERMSLPTIQALLSRVLFADPDARPYADPYYWAPFVFYGAAEARP